MELTRFQEQVFFTTVRITVPHARGSGASIGTGFLYKVPVSDEKSCILLVSNRHVYGNSSSPVVMALHKRDPKDPARPKLGEVHMLSGDSIEGIYTGHPDPKVDLACINVSMIGEIDPPLFWKNLDDSILVDFNHADLLPGNEVWFVGYPENRFDTKNNLPVLRRGYIASIPKVNFEGERQFLIDALVFPGSSGSPVFTSLGGHFKLIGVVAQTMIKNEMIQVVPTGAVPAVQQILGLGIVLRADLLQELLESATRGIINRLRKSEAEPTSDARSNVEDALPDNDAHTSDKSPG